MCFNDIFSLSRGQHVPGSFWNDQLFSLAVGCCLHPSSLGFNVGDVETMERLPREVCVCVCVEIEMKGQ